MTSAIARAAGGAQAFDHIVLALPSEIDDALVCAGSTYPGMAGDGTLVADVLGAAGFARTPALVLNDAELAAVAARELVAPGARALVLTVGFAVGAAVLDA